MRREYGAGRAAGALGLGIGAALAVIAWWPSAAFACSASAGGPTIRHLGDGAVVLVGITGDRVGGGREFFVERVFAGEVMSSPIVIAFQEGEPVGDCSYPVAAGTHLIIAPEVAPDGTLSANLATVQADPDSDVGRRLILEARARYGDGYGPAVDARPPGPDLRIPALVLGLGLVAALAGLAWRRKRRQSRSGY